MIDKHQLWEKILFDQGVEDRLLHVFAEKAEYMRTPDHTPSATGVLQTTLNEMRGDFLRELRTAQGPRGLGQILDGPLQDALASPPPTLLREVAEYIKGEVPEEQKDLVRWDV